MRQRRTIYHNDARHYYLWLYDPPMRLEDAWRPIDDVAGTAVDTFSYCVAREDGLFYDSKVGMRFAADKRPFTNAIYWHYWESVNSLIDQGHDPLKLLIDRAHEKGMDFFADLRLAGYGGMDPAHKLAEGGRGFAHREVREHQFAVLQELATQYPTEGVELDFAAAAVDKPSYFRPEEVTAYTPVMTEWVRGVSAMVRGRPGGPGQVGARVYPTEEMNLQQGLDVRTWLKEGLLDFVVPLLYGYNRLDPDMPIDWLIEAAHEEDVSVYGMLQTYVSDLSTGSETRAYPTREMMRAAAANYWARGVDGLYTWFMRWPHGDAERAILSELGDPDLIKEGDKHYVLRRRSPEGPGTDYGASLPVSIPSADPAVRYSIPLYIADDIEGASDRIGAVKLRIRIMNLVTPDRLTVLLNGQSLSKETCLREFGQNTPHIAPRGQWLEFHLRRVRPNKGRNVLEISLNERPPGLEGGVTVENVEVIVEYTPYPPGLAFSP